MKIEYPIEAKFITKIIGLLFLIFYVDAGVADDKALKRLETIIQQQQLQIEAQGRALDETRKQLKALQQHMHISENDKKGIAASNSGAALLITDSPQDIEPVDPSIEENRMEYHDFHHFKVPGFDSKVTITGFIKGSVFHDLDAIASPTEFITSSIIVDGQPAGTPDSRTTFTANDSRLLVASATPTALGRFSTLLSVDFFRDPFSTTPELRLRQAYGQLDNILFGGTLRAGQSWSTWDDVPGLPETLDFQGPNGSQQTRPVLLRWARDVGRFWRIWAALENPDNSIENGLTRTRWPDGVLAFNYQWGKNYVKPAILLRDVGGETASGRVDYRFGWGVSLSSTMMLPIFHEKDNLRMQIVYGYGIGSFMNDSGVNDAVFNGNNLELLPVYSGFAAYQHWWLEGVRSNAVFGWVNIDSRGGEPDNAYRSTLYVAGNLIWSPIKAIDLGTEFLWGQRNNKNGASGEATRIQFSGKYKF